MSAEDVEKAAKKVLCSCAMDTMPLARRRRRQEEEETGWVDR